MNESDTLKFFDHNRAEFRPYGLTCELWSPKLMGKFDRHNEIEINYFPQGSVSYFFQDRKITIPPKRLTVFWGLIPHQIVNFEETASYYVCTIPLSQFLGWKLPTPVADKILGGEVLIETSEEYAVHDEFQLRNWFEDINHTTSIEATLIEMRARLMRLGSHAAIHRNTHSPGIHSSETDIVEQIAIYIARNYTRPIKISDIGKAVGLHPDYANSIFRKAYGRSLYEHILYERITYAQRELVLTDSSIAGIAFECGFNSISRFNAAFLQINGCTPREFRKFKYGTVASQRNE